MNFKRDILAVYPALKNIPENRFPKHLLIIPDGNRRWAKKKNKFALFGHKEGLQVMKKILRDLSKLKTISIITLWGFSADNWKRSKEEVSGLMFLFEKQIKELVKELKQRNARFIHLGRKDRLPKNLLKTIKNAEEETKNNLGQIVCLAIDFGGDDQDLRIIEKTKYLPDEIQITKDLLFKLRDGEGLIPPADLLIRTAGEMRTSDIGWLNGAPTELYFIEKFFPDITIEDIIKAIINFSKRERRLGGGKEIIKEDHIVLVNEKNIAIGTAPKLASHHADTPLHRGFSLFLFNDKGELLLQQRSKKKKTWPLIWSNTCCGHPMLDESNITAAERRLKFELGIEKAKIYELLPKYRYKFERGGIVENEFCPVLVAFSNEQPVINQDEVVRIRWISWRDWTSEVKNNLNKYSEWCVEETKLLDKNKKFHSILKKEISHTL